MTSRALLQRRKYVGALLEHPPGGSPVAEAAPTSHFPYRGKRLEQRRSEGVTAAAPNLANMSEHRRSNRHASAPARPRPMLKTPRPPKVVRSARPPRLRRHLSPSYQRSRAYGRGYLALVWAELNRGTGGALSVRGALAAMTDKQTY